MPQVARLGDKSTGHGCFPSRPNILGSTNVFVNNIPAHRQGDAWAIHACGPIVHGGVLAMGSPNVYVNNRQLGRVTDPVSCGDRVGFGSLNVFANG